MSKRDRAAASRLQVTSAAIDTALADALSQRQISTIYTERNQYYVVMETLPWLQRDGLLVGVNWAGLRATGYDVAPPQVIEWFGR